MEKNVSIGDITNFIKELETNYNLLDYEIDGIYFWKLIRITVLEELIEMAIPTKKKLSKRDPLNIFKWANTNIKRELEILKYNASYSKEDTDILIFQDPRKTMYKEKRTDIYTYFIMETLKKIESISYHTLERNLIDKEYYIENNIKIAKSSVVKGAILREYLKITFKKADAEFLNKIKNIIKAKFNVEINISHLAANALGIFKTEVTYYTKLFKNIKCKKIVLTDSYGREGLISAAQSNKIEVIEMQHGVMNQHHLGYAFTRGKNTPYFPDKIMIFGEFWNHITPLPLEQKDIKVIGYPYLTAQLDKYSSITKKKKNIIFLSNCVEGLDALAFEFAKKNKEYNIVYRFHPKEYKTWKKNFPMLIEAEKLSNFVVDNNELTSLHGLLADAEFQVGINSTAIFEGLMLGCKTIIIMLPGALEYMGDLIRKNIVMTANNTKELEMAIKHFRGFNFNKEYFFSKYDEKSVLQILEANKD